MTHAISRIFGMHLTVDVVVVIFLNMALMMGARSRIRLGCTRHRTIVVYVATIEVIDGIGVPGTTA